MIANLYAAVLIGAVLAGPFTAPPVPDVPDPPTALVERLEDNDQVVVEVCVDGDLWFFDVPASRFSGPCEPGDMVPVTRHEERAGTTVYTLDIGDPVVLMIHD